MGVKAVRIEVRFLIDDVLLKLDVRCKKKYAWLLLLLYFFRSEMKGR